MKTNATVERLNERVADVMRRRGLGNLWHVDRDPNEAVDFEYCYPVIEIQ
jgi:hypothetical protein